jgi:hypothetical protein
LYVRFHCLLAVILVPTNAEAGQATLRGVVVDSVTEEPIEAARVVVAPTNRETWSSAAGVFTVGPLSAGRYQIQFEAHQYEARAFVFTIDSLALHEHDLGLISMVPAESILVSVNGMVQGPDSQVVGATVSVNDRVLGVTGFAGVFGGVVTLPLGLNTIQVRAMGFAPASDVVWFDGTDSVMTVNVTLEAFPVRLPDLVVEGEVPEGKLSMFHRHRRSESGSYLYGAGLEAARRFTVTDLLRSIPGVRVLPGVNTVRLSRASNTPGCLGAQPQFFVDGRPLRLGQGASINDVIEQDHVIAIAVYNGAARIPVVYNRGDAACGGVVALWTR